MSRRSTIQDIRPVQPGIRSSSAPRHRPPVPPPLGASGRGRGRASSPMRVSRPLSASTPARTVNATRSLAPPEVDTICHGPDISMLFPNVNDAIGFGSLEDFEKPDYAVKLEAVMTARNELREQRSESRRLKHIAARNEILRPNLIGEFGSPHVNLS